MQFGKKMCLKSWLSIKILYGPDPKLIGISGNILTQFSRFQIESDSNTLKITSVEELFLSKNTGGKYIISKPVGYHSELNL